MKLISMKCPNCHADVEVNPELGLAHCNYCGNQFMIEKEKTIQEKIKETKELNYARTKGQLQAEKEFQTKERLTKVITVLGSILLLIAFFWGFYKISYSMMEEIEDPFESIRIVYNGTDGHGYAEFEYITDVDFSYRPADIDYEFDEHSELKNGDVIHVYAKSTKYRFKTDSKSYTVSGLLGYVSDLAKLSSDNIDTLKMYSNEIQNKKLDSDKYSSHNSLTPYKLYLKTDNKDSVYLLMLSKVNIVAENNQTFSRIVLTKFERPIIDNNLQLTYYNADVDGDFNYCGGFAVGRNHCFVYAFDNEILAEEYMNSHYESNKGLTMNTTSINI